MNTPNKEINFLNVYNSISFIINFLLSVPLIVFQAIVFIIYLSIPAFLCFLISIIIEAFLYWVAMAGEEVALIQVVSENLIDDEQFSECNFKHWSLDEILGEDNSICDVDSRLDDPTYILSNTKLYNKLNKSMIGSVSVYEIINPIDKESPIITGAFAYSIANKTLIFITDAPPSMGIIQKFILYHEIGHALNLGKISVTETKLLRMFYVSMILLIPFELEWTWQAFLLFTTFVLSSLDFFGNALLTRFHRGKFQSEIMADEFAIQQLNDSDRKKVLRLLKSEKDHLADRTFTNDENYIRLGRLIAKLENKPVDDTLLTAVSFWDNQYRFLFLITLALNVYNPTYWHVLGFGLFALWFGEKSIRLTKESMRLNIKFYDYLKSKTL